MFKNNFAPLPVITTDTVIMSPKKPLDKGKAKEATSSENTAPLPPKILKEPTAPPAPLPKSNSNAEDTLMPDANGDLTQSTIVNPKEKISQVNFPGNTLKNDFTKIPVTTKFILCADPSNVPGYTNREKETSTDRLHAELVGYEGSRTVTHRKRKLVLAYFKDNETLKLAMNIKTARDGKSPFTIYDEAEINHEITQQRDNEKSRSIRVTNIPPSHNFETLHKFFTTFGEIDRLSLVRKPIHNIAYIVFKSIETAQKFEDQWFIYMDKDTLRVTPLYVDRDELKTRDLHVVKLAGLPTFTYARDIQDIVTKMKGKHCFIPRNKNDRPCNYAYIRFASEDDRTNALAMIDLQYKDRKLYISSIDAKSCYNCGNPQHILNKCDKPILMYQNTPNNRKSTPNAPRQYQTFSYDRYGPNPYLDVQSDDEMEDHSGPIKRNTNSYNNRSYANIVKGNYKGNKTPRYNTNNNYNNNVGKHTNQNNDNVHLGLKELAESIKSLAQEIKECNEDMRVMTIAMSNLNTRISTLEEFYDESDPNLTSGEETPKDDSPTEPLVKKIPLDPRMILDTDFTTVQTPTKGSIFEREIEHLKTDSKYLTDRQNKLDNTMTTINSMINSITKFFPGSKHTDQSTIPNSNRKHSSSGEVPNCLAEQSTSASGSK